MAQIIDGKAIALAVRNDVARGVEAFRRRHGRVPALHVVVAGDDPASGTYVRLKEKACAAVGMSGQVHRLPADIPLDAVLALLARLEADAGVDGILVQLPLPAHLPVTPVLEAISPTKDVDGFHPDNVGRLWSGKSGLVPCTPRGCMRLLQATGAQLGGARALVVGRSNLVGKPMAALLLEADATVTLAHSRTRSLAELCRQAEVLVVAAGQPKLVAGDWIRPGAVVIDVGMNTGPDGRLCGDVDFEAAKNVAAAITPVPGGVGPMTIAMLLDNTLLAACRRLDGRARSA